MDKRKEIVKTIQEMAGRYSAYEIFTDWIRCLALSIEQSTHLLRDERWESREQEYIDTIKKYSDEEKTKIYKMTAYLIDTLEDGPDDVLGDVYMKSDMGSKAAGQFFTPFHLSVLTAKLGLMEQIQAYKIGKLEKIEINEPACGGGAMILAAAKVLQESGVNYQEAMEVVAQDLDWKGVYMCYVQLSLLGISAICVQGDTLSSPYDPERTGKGHMLKTPRKAGLLV